MYLYILITKHCWDETSKNDDSFKKVTMSAFVGKTVKEVQQFLKQRGVISSGYLKAGLLDENISLLSDRELWY